MTVTDVIKVHVIFLLAMYIKISLLCKVHTLHTGMSETKF